MKLNKIKFASLIGFISCRYALTVTQDDMQEIDAIIDIEVEQPVGITADQLAALLQQLSKPGFSKIEAIKLVRSYYGFDLKKAKDFVEQNFYFNLPNGRIDEPATLGDILKATRQMEDNFDKFEG